MLREISARIIGTLLAAIALSSLATNVYASTGAGTGILDTSEDKFGIMKVHPTAEGGREWFIDMENPKDGIFDPRTAIERQRDGSWRVSGEDNGKYQVRMNVYSPKPEQEWKNVEITGYAKVVRTLGHSPNDNSDLDNVLQWYGRSGEKHSDSNPCDGTSIKGRLHLDGRVGWKKEIWHSGGYTDERGTNRATEPLVMNYNSEGGYYYEGKWIGFKVVIYNIQNDTAVKMEAYIDEDATNEWKKVSELVDDGGWYADSKKFTQKDCNKERDHVLTEARPIVAFRSDKIEWDFKDLSVREIEPPVDVSSIPQFSFFGQ